MSQQKLFQKLFLASMRSWRTKEFKKRIPHNVKKYIDSTVFCVSNILQPLSLQNIIYYMIVGIPNYISFGHLEQ